jgi:hypothetical protein
MDNGIRFNNHDRHIYAFEHVFDRVCREHQIEHRHTKIRPPWANSPLSAIVSNRLPGNGSDA